MNETHDECKDLIDRIIAIELDMFQRVNSRGNAPCQEMPGTFRTMRWMAHSVLSRDTLASYLDDLEQARKAGRNLMTEKYARMEGLIPPLKNDPEVIALLDEITEIEENWIVEFSKAYPKIITGDGSAFAAYLRCELETYSDRTLELYHRDVLEARRQGISLARKSYENLFKGLGYSSFEDVEKNT